jgi:BirA family biotin operon repressor/biotin-[acetyl-CoA-carboxylase] ligase
LSEPPGKGAESCSQSPGHKILELFRKKQGTVLSGEELGTTLHISRTAVWKHIRALKRLGYLIEAVPGQGYRLISSPDILTPAELSTDLGTKRIGSEIICFSEIESTNTAAFHLAEEGAEEGTVIIAETQSHGKGRLGRHWESPEGVNLYCSVVLRPPLPPQNAPQLTFLSAVAVAQAVENFTGLHPLIKWPNDILVNGKKVAGLLNEMSAETDQINFVIMGIGVNINMQVDQFPDHLRYPATSLVIEAGAKISRRGFTRSLIVSLDLLYANFLNHGFSRIREEWISRSALTGRKVRVCTESGDEFGTAAGIDEDGAFLIRSREGKTHRILSGDVFPVE